ncbi:MAG TPA: ribose-5-phosphate isomerase RpiA [Candidatus Binataceae bacterium]|nr:ribose-5-phosphate isomerase RpiA [Candidatus Binataceae bacterium]
MTTIDHTPLDKLAEYAIRLVKPGMTIGLGTGRAASAFIRALGARRIKVRGVPTSLASEELARECGIKLTTLGEADKIDIDFDGADEVDPELNLIKGYGGALVREKIVAAASRRVVILVGPEKLVKHLGAHRRLPIETVPFARDYVARRLKPLGLKARDRRNGDGSKFLSDNGNPILDCAVGEIRSPARLDRDVTQIPGVVGTGLFVGMTDMVLVAPSPGEPVRVLRRKR